jgi:alkanesulfonate monooxygenase SsuD/methylene tetrahydromethanopterin reductase-like flavin-dependent oxidoreductase (luciferase family)
VHFLVQHCICFCNTGCLRFTSRWVTYAYLAGVTKNLGLTTGVIILPQRQTALFAKQAADVTFS